MLKSVKLKDISKLIGSGITPLRSNELFWKDGAISWLKTEQLGEFEIYETSEKISTHAIDETSIKIFPINTLSIAMYGEGKTRGNVSILKKEMTTNQACCNIVLDPKKADYKYVYYFLKTQYNQLRNLSSGVRKNLNSNDIKEFEVRIPENIKDQERISSILYNIDSKIELNNKINAELEAMAKTIYDYWFVQFDFPNAKGKPYKTSGGKMVWNEELKREIPNEWTVDIIEKCCSIIDCLHSKKSNLVYEDEQSYLLQLNNILDNGLIDLTDKYYVTKAEYKKWTTRIEVIDGDIVITNAGRVAATAQIPIGVKAGIGRNITAIRPVNIKPNYLFLSFSGADIKRQIKLNTDSGAFFTSFNVKGIKKLQLLRANNNIEEQFEKLVLPIRRQRELNNSANQKLAELRDWLLPMLMNGQVKVD